MCLFVYFCQPSIIIWFVVIFFAVVVVGSVGIVLFLSLYSIFPLDSLKASLKHGRSFFIRSFNIVSH